MMPFHWVTQYVLHNVKVVLKSFQSILKALEQILFQITLVSTLISQKLNNSLQDSAVYTVVQWDYILPCYIVTHVVERCGALPPVVMVAA